MSKKTQSILESIKANAETALVEYEKLSVKGTKAAAPRARKALGEIAKACKEARAMITEEVKAL